jgi:signal transduction histidine kinase
VSSTTAEVLHRQRLEHLGVLASSTVHELKNLLTPMILGVELAVLEVPLEHPAQASLATVLSVARRAREIVQRFAEYGAIRHCTPRAVALNEIVREAVALLRSSLPTGSNITHLPPKSDLPPVLTDPVYAHQVITNLLVNAFEALKPGAGEIEISLETETITEAGSGEPFHPAPGNYVRLTVKDDGVGMDDATRNRIFEKFFTTKASAGGTGLGLAIVREIMRKTGGGLMVESVPDHGATFRVYWPVASHETVPSS